MSSDPILLLQLEHGHMQRLLQVLEIQTERLEAGGSWNPKLLGLAFDYLLGYPDECHHPKEDLVYRKLRSRSPEAAAQMTDLLREHGQLARLTRETAEQLRRATHEGASEATRLAPMLRRFLALYRKHMTEEEQRFFPAASHTLTSSDLAEIEFQLFDRPDPLFHRDAEARFRELRAEIDRLAERADDDEEALLASFTLARFNERFADRGVRLAPREGGGFRIEQGGRAVVEIPPCSDERAAWCAYYWLLGTGASAKRT